jgi:hypothetical protein
MSPEDLPLRDLHLPDVTGWWPLAPGWWFLIALLVFGLVVLVRRSFRKWQHNAPRRLALKRLAAINDEFDDGKSAVVLGKELSELTRRAMLAYSSRQEVAGLTGDDWLQWLDQGLDDNPFSTGAGKILESLPYINPQAVNDETDVSGLIDAVRRRLAQPMDENQLR